MSYFAWVITGLVALFGIQLEILSKCGSSTTKSESNFFSSVARVQTGVQDHPKIMLLGSSMTGRLPDRDSGFKGVSNLGCDGGSAVDMLRAIDRDLIPAAPMLIIEGNTLYHSLDNKSHGVYDEVVKPWFRLGLHIPMIAANARPSAMAYSFLRAFKFGHPEGPNGPLLPVAAKPRTSWPRETLPANAYPLLKELQGIVHRLETRHIRIFLVILPPCKDKKNPSAKLSRELSRTTGVPLIDLTDGLPAGVVHLTDGTHMNLHSASMSLRTILAAIHHRDR